MVLERDVLKNCLEYLHLAHPDWLVWRQNQGAIPLPGGGYRRFVGRKGLPDLFAIIPPNGKLCGIEVKRPGGVMSDDQIRFHEDLADVGGIALCVSSVEELESDLRSLGL